MTDFEVAYLYNETVGLLSTLAMQYFTILFAFLTASTLAAQRLTRNLAIMVVIMFTFAQLLPMVTAIRVMHSFGGLIELLNSKAASGADLKWHGAYGVNAEWFELVPSMLTCMFILAHVGAIYFFFQCRRGAFQFSLAKP